MLCLFQERDREKITVIEPTERGCEEVEDCTVCDALAKKAEVVEADNKVKALRRAVSDTKEAIREKRIFRNMLTALDRAKKAQTPSESVAEADAALEQLAKDLEEREAEVKEAEEGMVKFGRPFLEDQLHNSRPQFENIGRVTVVYCGPLGEQEQKERNQGPLPEWMEKEARKSVPYGLIDLDPRFAKPDPLLEKVEPVNYKTEAAEYLKGYIPR